MRRIHYPFAWIACSVIPSLAGCASNPAHVTEVPVDGDGDHGGGAGGPPGSGSGAGAVGCDALAVELQAALDAAIDAQGLPGAAAAVDVGGCSFRGAAGLADIEAKTPVHPGDLFRAGSITKTFISTLVLMLRAEGELSLEDDVSRYVEGVPGGDRITVRQILNHTSGLFNYTETHGFLSAVEADPTRVWTPEELIAFSAGEPPCFEPGRRFEYSNTNYIVAGLIVEAVSGEPVVELLRARILEPAGLASTYLDGAEPAVPGLVHGYGSYDGELVDTTSAVDPSSAWTSGGLVSNTDDLTTFFVRLLDGGLLGPAELADMTAGVGAEEADLLDYGLGLAQRSSPVGITYGHGGSMWGFVAASYYAVERGAAITVLVNHEDGDAGRIVDDLSRALEMP
ncbi:serine hydrolase domain-containing protein [Sorangium sp. So ce341]|uniref:serine hydrolase domain-containing protein n=1 Tax=Sorangium sp. So ce341 TaxID=3133302 RepID=UPI003F63B1A8